MIDVRITGDKQVFRHLKELPKNMQNRVLKRAAREAMKPALAATRSAAPRGKTGNLRRSIKSKARKRSRVSVGQEIATKSEWFKGPEYYAAFQEFGWHIGKRENWMRSRGKWTGIGSEQDTRTFVEGKHFVENTFDTQQGAIAQRFTELCRRYMETGLPQDRRGAHLTSGGKA